MTGVRRFGMAARLVPEKREEYLELHRAVWPAVENTIRVCGIRHMAADPSTQEWWTRTAPCQLPFEPGSSAANWHELEEAWHLD